MPLFGAHMSINGGFHRAVEQATACACDTVQLFTKAPSQWSAKPIEDDQARRFKDALAASGLRLPTAHDSYLINLASPDDTLWRRSVEAAVDEMNRADKLGLSYLVMHPGAHMDAGEAAGLERVIRGLDEVHARCPEHHVRILIETTAGQGTTLGHRFEHLATILQGVKQGERLGVCLDTCHVFAAGYPLAPADDYAATMAEFDRLVGLRRIEVFHVNDSLKPRGSRVDRHAHIGRGEMGLEPFRLLVNDSRFTERPMILETPKEAGEEEMDPVNLRTLRELIAVGG
ncbi:MAG: deoxyribonuclease IV [Gemmataceae bacterium]